MPTLRVICESDDCRRRGKIINRFTVPDDMIESVIESFGSGGEDPEHDLCRSCGQIGVLDDSALFAPAG